MRTVLGTLVAVVLLAASGLASEIKSTTKLTIVRAGIDAPLEVTDPAVLALSHVFTGTFIGPDALPPGSELTRYTIGFDVQTLAGVKTRAYVVHYCVDDVTGAGFIYLPGRGDADYRRNASTILRDGRDGRWHFASEEWSAAVREYLQ